MEFLGRSLREMRAADETVLRRMQALWESRLGSGEASGSPKELGAFGWWFSAGVLADEWRLAQAEAVLKEGVRLEPNFAVFATLAALAPGRPRPTARILRMMLEQEKDGAVYNLRGAAEIHYGTYILYADEVTYNSETGDAKAEGHVVLDGGPNDEHIRATRGTYNTRSEVGRFENVAAPRAFAFTGRG